MISYAADVNMQTIQEEIERCQSVKVHDCKRECGPQILNQIKQELATCSFLGGPTIKEFQYPQIYGFHAHTVGVSNHSARILQNRSGCSLFTSIYGFPILCS